MSKRKMEIIFPISLIIPINNINIINNMIINVNNHLREINNRKLRGKGKKRGYLPIISKKGA